MNEHLNLWKPKTVRVPTLLGWAFLMSLFIGFSLSALQIVPRVLQIRRPVSTKILVAEGWMKRDMMKEVIREFNQGNYELLLVTGGPVDDHDPIEHASGADTFAEQGAWALRSLGFPHQKIIAVPTKNSSQRNRTLSFALSLVDWLEKNRPETTAFNIATESFHSRRSYWTYQRAFQKAGHKTSKAQYQVGILGIHDPYLTSPWWSTSIGFKHVIMESIAVLYSIPNLFLKN